MTGVFRAKTRRGFSLAELMIALVILGLGLLVVAAMFPIAWLKAREVAWNASSTSCGATAQSLVQLLCQPVQDLNRDGSVDTFSSFLGDLDTHWDTYVHALNLGNLPVEDLWGSNNKLNLVADFYPAGGASAEETTNPDPECAPVNGYARGASPQISLFDRLYPPLPEPGDRPDEKHRQHWQAQLDQRRTSWSVLHRFLESQRPNPGQRRLMQLYVVTSRRPQSVYRYARQDHKFAPGYPDVINDQAAEPKPLGPEEDVLFPVPWRVQVLFKVPVVVGSDPIEVRSGIPAQASATGQIVVDMLPEGAMLIDERSGNIYRVARRDLDATTDPPEGALLTFDSEVSLASLNGWPGRAGDNFDDGIADYWVTVWVFPPPVEPREDKNSPLIFNGPPPVVGVEVRTVSF